MSKNCKFIVNVKGANGQVVNTLTFDVSPEEISTPQAFALLLKNNPDKLEILKDSINNTNFPSIQLTEDDISGDMLCNYSLNTALNIMGKDDKQLQGYYNTVKDFANVDDFNILITDLTDKLGIYYSKQFNRNIVVIRPTKQAFKLYLKFLIIQNAIQNDSSEIASALLQSIINIKNDFEKHKGLKELFPALLDAVTTNNLNKFLAICFFDYDTWNRYLENYEGFKETKDKFSELYKYSNISIEAFKDLPLIYEFLQTTTVELKEVPDPNDSTKTITLTIIKPNKNISLKKIKELAEKYKLSSDLKDPVNFTLYINQQIANVGNDFGYFKIVFLGKDKIIYQKTEDLPDITSPVINSVYYGDMIEPMYHYGHYNIYRIDNKIYVSTVIPQTTDMVNMDKFNYSSIGRARKYIDHELSFKKLRSYFNDDFMIKNLFSKVPSILSFGKPLPKKFKFISYVLVDKKTKKETLIHFEKIPDFKPMDELNELLDKSFKDAVIALNNLNSSLKFRILKESLTTEQQQILVETVKDSPQKLLIFLILAQTGLNANWANNLKRKEAIVNAFNIVTKLQERLLNVTKNDGIESYDKDKDEWKYDINTTYIAKPEKNEPLFTSKLNNVKLDLNLIAETLHSVFGVTINIVTTAEISKNFKGIDPTAKAFILGGQIYINANRAYASTLVHEFGHLIFGTLKQTNPLMYIKFMEIIDSLSEKYPQLFNKYKNSPRSRYDIDEEVFADLFGDYITKGITKGINTSTTDIKELKEAIKRNISLIFGINTSDGNFKNTKVAELLTSTLLQIKTQFGADNITTDLLDEIKDPNLELFSLTKARTSRTTANIIETLRRNNLLTETCI